MSVDQHSKIIEKEKAQEFLGFVDSKIKNLVWTSEFINSIETDSVEFVRGDFDEQIRRELDAPDFVQISLSIRERQMLEAVALFVERQLNKQSPGRKKKWNSAKEKNAFFNAKRKN